MGFESDTVQYICTRPRSVFGMKSAPPGFCLLTAEVTATVQRWLLANPATCLAMVWPHTHVDDQDVNGPDEESTAAGKRVLQEVINEVGGTRSDKKSWGPAQQYTSHGWDIDTRKPAIAVNAEKRHDYALFKLICLRLA